MERSGDTETMHGDHPGPLRGATVLLRPVTRDDVDPLATILARPEVAAWWAGYDRARVDRELFDEEDETVIFVIEVDSQAVGLIQYAEENEPDYRHASIDIFLSPDFHGHGLGSDAIRTVARYLFEERGHHRLTIDPAAHNGRAIRAYERVGFRPIGIMRQYERGADGTWHDGLLMDLLRDELR